MIQFEFLNLMYINVVILKMLYFLHLNYIYIKFRQKLKLLNFTIKYV